MRRYLSDDQRRVFELAWSMLPPTVATQLRQFIKSVRVVTSLDGHQIRCADGSFIDCDGVEGAAYCGVDGTRRPIRGFIVLTERLMSGDEDGFIIATILHELAHAWGYAEHGHRATLVEEECSEASAWMEAGAWALFSGADVALTKTIALHCVLRACQDGWGFRPITEWMELTAQVKALKGQS